MALLTEYLLTPEQVVYIESGRHYVPESSTTLRQYFERFPISEGSVVLSDRGNAVFSRKNPYSSLIWSLPH